MRSQAGEHILLESDVRDLPDRERARIVHATLQCRSRLRMHRLELAIIDYYYLAVRMSRTGTVSDYVLDLRCVDRSVCATRHIPWKWILATLLLASAAIFSVEQAATTSAHSLRPHQLLLCAITLGLATCAGLVCAWRTTETLSLRSLNGGATLLDYTGGLGTLRTSRKFAGKLAAHIQFAVAHRRATQAEQLRDEMREHFRLKEAGVLSRDQYEASKAQILARHAPVSSRRRPAISPAAH